MFLCDRCCIASTTVRKSPLQVPGVSPTCKCKKFRLCKPCRDELLAALQ